MRITSRQIEIFLMAYHHRSTRRAAEALHVSQPAVSRTIANLEEEMGLVLFDRTNRKFEPNAAANSLQQAVQKHYQGLDRVKEAAKQIAAGVGGLLKVATLPAVADSRVAIAAGRLMAQYPALRIDIDVLNERASLAALREGRVDCAIISTDPGDANLASSRLADVQPIAIVHGRDVLAKQRQVSPIEFAEVAQIMLPVRSPFRRLVEQMFDQAKAPFQVRAEVRTQTALIHMVAQGAGRAIVDREVLELVSNAAVVPLELDSGMTWPIRIVTSSGSHSAPGLQRFIAELRRLA